MPYQARIDSADDRLMSIKELMERWEVSRRTLEIWRKEAKGPQPIDIGGKFKYRLSEVIAYENQNRVDQNSSGRPNNFINKGDDS